MSPTQAPITGRRIAWLATLTGLYWVVLIACVREFLTMVGMFPYVAPFLVLFFALAVFQARALVIGMRERKRDQQLALR
jgi:hypothetical protein